MEPTQLKKMTEPLNLKVWRSHWSREGRKEFGSSYMLNPQGNMCCLGQITLQLGADPSCMVHRCYPSGVADTYLKRGLPVPSALDEFFEVVQQDVEDVSVTSVEHRMAGQNDHGGMHPQYVGSFVNMPGPLPANPDHEALLKHGFAAININVEFTDEPLPEEYAIAILAAL